MKKAIGIGLMFLGLLIIFAAIPLSGVVQLSSIGSHYVSHFSSIYAKADVKQNSIDVFGNAALNPRSTNGFVTDSQFEPNYIYAWASGAIVVDGRAVKVCGNSAGMGLNAGALNSEKQFQFWFLNKDEFPDLSCTASISTSSLSAGEHEIYYEIKTSKFNSENGAKEIENGLCPAGANCPIDKPVRDVKLLSCNGQIKACTGSHLFCDWYVSYSSSAENPCPDSSSYLSPEFRMKYWDSFSMDCPTPASASCTGYTYTSPKIKVFVGDSVDVNNPSNVDWLLLSLLFIFGLLLIGAGYFIGFALKNKKRRYE